MRRKLLLGLCLWLLPLAAIAAPTVAVQEAWARATLPGQDVGAAYLTLQSAEDATLTGIASPAADSIEIHTMSLHNGVMKMRRLKTLPLPAGKAVKLAPGGAHLMLFDLKQPLKAGEQLTLHLQFADPKGRQTSQAIQVPVRDTSD